MAIAWRWRRRRRQQQVAAVAFVSIVIVVAVIVAVSVAVGDNEIGEPADGLATEVVAEPDVACHSERGERERAPLLWVRGERWSPGVYRSLRLLGRPLTVAWEGAFIALPTF